jgi:hypothetical protein
MCLLSFFPKLVSKQKRESNQSKKEKLSEGQSAFQKGASSVTTNSVIISPTAGYHYYSSFLFWPDNISHCPMLSHVWPFSFFLLIL